MNERIRKLAIQSGAGEWGDSIVPAMMAECYVYDNDYDDVFEY